MLHRRWRQVLRREILMMMMMMRRYPGVLGIGCPGVVRGQRMLTGMMRELLHRRGRGIMMQRREEAQSAFGGGGTRCVEIVIPTQKKVARPVSRMMAHVMSHVRGRYVRGRVRVMRRIALMMEVVMLLRRRFDPRGWLNAGDDVARSTGHSTTPG